MKHLENQFRQETEESLNSQAFYLELEFDQQLAVALEKVRVKCVKQTEEVVGTLIEHFDKCFRVSVIFEIQMM